MTKIDSALTILIQRENPALPMSDGCSDARSEPRSKQGVNESIDRHDPWGESLPLKPAGDDISRDGSACDSATTHRETSEEPSQMTLSTFHGSEPSASNSET